MSVLKVILIGHLGQDPELRSFPDGGSVCNISVAHTEKWKDKQTGQQQEKTEWCRVVLRDRGNYRMAQLAGQYLRKGSKVYIEGKLQTRKYNDAQGIERYVTEIIADTMQFLDSRQTGQGDAYPSSYDSQYGAPSQPQYQAPPVQQSAPAAMQQNYQAQVAAQNQAQAAMPSAAPTPMAVPESSSAPFPSSDEFDDDIPF